MHTYSTVEIYINTLSTNSEPYPSGEKALIHEDNFVYIHAV